MRLTALGLIAIAISPAALAVSEWNSNTIYATPGTQVSYQGQLYQNNWWTKGEIPGQTGPWGVWSKVGSNSPAPTVAPTFTTTPKPVTTATPTPTSSSMPNSIQLWDANAIYAQAGQLVSYQGQVYRNQWWTRGDNPAQSSVWRLIGAAATPSSTPLVSATPRPTLAPTPVATLTPSASPKPSPTATPVASATPAPTAAPVPTVSPSPVANSCAATAITALTPSAGVARIGSVYSSTLYDPSNETSGNDTHRPQVIKVQVSNAGKPVAGCAVSWTPVNGNDSGWVFPLAEKTDSNGQISAWWTAGKASSQQVRASITLADGSRREAEITGQAFAHSTRANSIHLNWSSPLWNGFKVDVTPVSWAPTTYYSAINFPGGYTGIQTSQLLFSLWDVNGVSPVVIDKGMATCSNFGGEGTGIKCYAPYTPQANVTYRFELEVAATSDGKTDYTLYFTDLSNGQRKKFATMRYQAKVSPYGASAFVEDWYEEKASCLANTRRAAYFSNVQYRNPSTGAWSEIRKATGDAVYNEWHNEICANYSFSAEGGRFLMGTGGEVVGQPLNLPNGPSVINLSLD
ncbi:DUF3472 domain-containing protein [Chitinibacter tainanensis]|uniref:DUF3472 domain-containing protein n=1 Tax=Chitinibacter tainanensis TaxID=230667 RepID=UPI0003FB84E6|nr:DUF3472 domain-containing protein [Chitinibacter tainanensis]